MITRTFGNDKTYYAARAAKNKFLKSTKFWLRRDIVHSTTLWCSMVVITNQDDIYIYF